MIYKIWYILSFVLLRIPSWIFVTANAIKFTIPFTTLFVTFIITSYVIYYIVKSRVLSQYKKLTPEKEELKSLGSSSSKCSSVNLDQARSSAQDKSSKHEKKNIFFHYEDDRSFSSYLDQFLSAIKIFGYLEKPVFNDLTKNMKTQKLNEGEILLLDDAIGLAIVVEGSLQIYHNVSDNSGNGIISNSYTKNCANDYINSASVNYSSEHSSISDNLKVENSCLDTNSNNSETSSNNDNYEESDGFSEDSNTYIRFKNGSGKYQLLNTVKPGNPVSSLVNILNLFTSKKSKQNSNNNAQENITNNNSTSNLSNSQNFSHFGAKDLSTLTFDDANPVFYPLPNIVARAATNCTIAIIPPKSFSKLVETYPRSASHIIQMVLTRLYRVTFQTAHDYLGLTSEIMEIEYLLNKNVRYELPYFLKEAVVNCYKHTKQAYSTNNNSKGSSIINLNSKTSNKSSSSTKSFLSEIPLKFSVPKSKSNSQLNTNNIFESFGGGSRNFVLKSSKDHSNPGDLLSNVPLTRRDLSTSDAVTPISSNNNFSAILDNALSPLLEFENEKRPVKIKNGFPEVSNNKSEKTQRGTLNSHSDSENDGKIKYFSLQEGTDEATLRFALVEAIFNILSINEESFYAKKSRTASLTTPTLTHRISNSSDNSLESSIYSTQQDYPDSAIKILPSEYAITSHKFKPKLSTTYKEEVPTSIDFESVKKEFSDNIDLQYHPKGETIVEQNNNSKGLFYVISGSIDVTYTNSPGMDYVPEMNSSNKEFNEDLKKVEQFLYTVESGGIAGYLASLVNSKSFVNLKARTDVYVGFLSNQTLERFYDKYCLLHLRLAEILTTLISPRMLKLDHALEWIHLSASETLFNKGDPANGIYVILNGRVRQVSDKHYFQSPELAQGESFGEVEVLTAMNRMSSIQAVRETELARIPRTLFGILALEQPSIMFRISRLVARKILDINLGSDVPTRVTADNGYKYDFNLMIPSLNGNAHKGAHPKNKNSYRTITILPVTEGLPVNSFANKLVQAFRQVGRNTIGLNMRTALNHLGRHAFDKLAKLKLSGYFAELEVMYQTVVYIADSPVNSSWTNTCISQGDCILLLADANDSADIGEYELLLQKVGTTARTELILLHPERYVEPGSTYNWLKQRNWVDAHHHMQFLVNPLSERLNMRSHNKNASRLALVDRIMNTEFSKLTQENISKYVPESIKSKVETISRRIRGRSHQYYSSSDPNKNDFLRLARILSDQAIGVVLGGGGARGISHLGVLQAIEEQGIPIDLIGGTSMGAFVAGLYAKDYDIVPIYGRLKSFCARIGSLWRMIGDLTWPVTSYTTGHEFNRGIWKTFGDTRIEDFWIQYYCNSTNITESIQEIHSFGYAWRYIRASMSLAGLLPPLEAKGSMLLDGGYVDNLPVDEMKGRGCDIVIAVDVGSVDDRTPMNYGDSLNGFWILFNKWNPFSSYPNIPTMAEIQMRLGYVSSVNALERAKRTPGIIYTRPPVADFATLDFGKFEQIYNVGLDYGRSYLKTLIENKNMPFIAGSKATLIDTAIPEFLSRRRNSI
ncbi:hypothetical protein TPHA_0B00540 [Tetrapisispora phaffii CBS 4417]|uniref:Lysophospholipase NTE1 n=1 Tax=Tetrapisispora phaffii (strain ATCC 24235 / CBS 4417 / NBRC 1672 / NRRL Y-8282 / UCD 70-5) TaxID=1071381 RepID=G8BQC9_TETPH|nr:hypothetical protein TPHA_0B00540 [Tetrapisispora phaffii CBS 4417]CCE61726.1 hypothetical protein TPHA_0B00540 [Tetrapisispora phaffii CBS 4417]